MGITLWQYYLNRARAIDDGALANFQTAESWQAQRETLRKQFMLSMGLWPEPPRGTVPVQDHGKLRGAGYRARKIALAILPDCWSTGAVFYPDPLPPGKLPAVLYVCGHQAIGMVGYQPHGILWARRGYVCLVIDTIEQHDSGGTHHGTYYRIRYDWLSMGYTAAGGELWNSLRALDLLAGLPEVDASRIGATGISGGGALSFYLGIADERVRAVASACGVTMPTYTLAHRHLQHHCDCIYFHNLFQRSTAEYAALVAPRPLLFCFASQDSLFSPPEYRALYEKTASVYRLLGAEDRCRLYEYDGPHGYKPETLDVINAWFDRHVSGQPHSRGELGAVEHGEAATTVFNGRPPEANRIYLLPELLSPRGSLQLPSGPGDWPDVRGRFVARLRKEAFSPLDRFDERLDVYDTGEWLVAGGTQGEQLRDYQVYRARVGGMDVHMSVDTRYTDSGKVVVALAGADETPHDLFQRLHYATEAHAVIGVEGRTGGLNGCHPAMAWDLLRGGALIGLTPTLIMIKDLELAVAFLRTLPCVGQRKVFLYGRSDAGVACLYAAVFDESIAGVVAEDIPASHAQGGHIPAIMRFMDIDHAAGLLAPRPVGLVNQARCRPMWGPRVYQRLGYPQRWIARSSLKLAFDLVLGE